MPGTPSEFWTNVPRERLVNTNSRCQQNVMLPVFLGFEDRGGGGKVGSVISALVDGTLINSSKIVNAKIAEAFSLLGGNNRREGFGFRSREETLCPSDGESVAVT